MTKMALRHVLPFTLVAGVAATAAADYTVTYKNKNESSQVGVLNSVFGTGDFAGNTPVSGTSFLTTGANVDVYPLSTTSNVFTSATLGLTATRLMDRGGLATFDIHSGDPATGNDQHFSDGTSTYTMELKVAGDNSEFGWFNDAAAAGFESLFNTSDIGTSKTIHLSSDFRFGLMDTTTGNTLSSDEHAYTNNKGDMTAVVDQMIMYEITGTGITHKTYLIAFEDRLQGEVYEDYDYNDAVVLMTVIIPLPQAGAMALAGIGGVAFVRRRTAP